MGTQKGTGSSGKSASGACGSIRGKSVGSARQCCAHSEYGSTYRVLTGYLKGTPSHGVLTGYFYFRVPTLRGALTGGCGAQRSARALNDRKGTHGVLPGY
jgi:hypothetical protein